MTIIKMNRRRWLLAATLLASLSSGGTAAAAEGPAGPLTTRLRPRSPAGRSPVVTAMAIDSAGKCLAVAGDDFAIRLLDAENLREIDRLQGHRDLVRTLAFRHDNRLLASAGNDGSLILWEAGPRWAPARRFDDLPTLFCVRFSPDAQQLAAVGFESQLLLFGVAPAAQVACDCADLRAVAYHESGNRLAVVGRSGMLHLFDRQGTEPLGKFPIHSSRVRDIVFLPGTEVAATVAEDGAVTLFDFQQKRVIQRIDLLPCKLFCVVAINASTIAVAGSDNRIRIVDCTAGKITTHLDAHHGSINSLVCHGGWLYSAGFDATVRRWKLPAEAAERVADKDSGDDRKR